MADFLLDLDGEAAPIGAGQRDPVRLALSACLCGI